MNRKAILVILDGRGLANPWQEHKSAIHLAQTPNFDKYWSSYPYSTLKTFGEHVGLPDGQMWNSEVGHMSIGSGRVIYQDLVKISKMLREWSFEDIQVFQDLISQAKSENKWIHLIGLLSDGWVHSHIDHLFWLIELLDKNWVTAYIHAITDWRDVDPKSWIIYIQKLLDFIKGKNAKLIDVIGRYYAMDRDNRRERVKLATDLYTRWVGKTTNDIIAEMQKNYDKWITDEFIKPIIYTPDFTQKDWIFNTIETERLTIKPVSEEDIQDIFDWASEEISEYLARNIKESFEDSANFVKKCIEQKTNKTDLVLVVREKTTNQFVWLGSIHNINKLNPFYGLRVSQNQQSKWFATEYTKAILDRAFINLDSKTYITYEAYEPNTASKNIANKIWAKLITTQEAKSRKHEKLLTNIYYIYNPNQLAAHEPAWPVGRAAGSENTPDINIKNWSIAIVTNFRTDRGRELVDALCQNDHLDFDIKKIDNLTIATMTNYDDKFQNVKVLLPRDNLTETLGEVIAKAWKNQIRIAETEKYPHVTFFFSGGQEQEFPNEKRILVPSPKVATYDLQPEMSAREITNSILPEISSEWPDFICLNFANTDMVWHTGDIQAAMKSAETVDDCLWQIVDTALAHSYDLIIIADHGNADIMYNDDKSPNTAHTTNLVPCIYISNNPITNQIKDWKLADIAPSFLELLNIPKPSSMDWESLFQN